MTQLLMVLTAALSLSAFAQAPASTCEAQADDKKLAGAARASFIQKCEREAAASAAGQSACEKTAAEKKLAGAAKNSFLKKCEKDAAQAK